MERFRRFFGKIPTGVLSGLTVAVILWLTLAPHPTGNLDLPLFPGADKVVHALMFGFLTFVVLFEIMKRRGWKPVSLPIAGVVAFAVSLFGFAIELIQRAMGLGREFEALDILADGAGAFIAAAIWAAMQNLFATDDQ